ncbi:transposase [Candidatus Microgenomates bacterium]|nr:transposase [Candidatus Microgenomates bacterium]
MRKTVLSINHVYHIYNRGVEKRKIFLDSADYSRFISTLKHCLDYNYPYSLLNLRLKQAESPEKKQKVLLQLETRRINPLVEIFSFCLMPNHYHLTLKQLVENGISSFMHKIGTAYTKYFNIHQDRSGRLFESSFKAIRVETDEQLIHLSRYQHLNPQSLDITKSNELVNYPWSSLSAYLKDKKFSFIKPETVLSAFKSSKSYLNFVLGEIDKFEVLRLEKTAIDDDFSWFGNFRALKKDRQEKLRQHYIKMLLQSNY